jgi:hypothetical protein
LQSTHQVDMKNIVECLKEFFAYFNALETYSDSGWCDLTFGAYSCTANQI